MNISEKQWVDTGMALTLLSLLVYVFFDHLTFMVVVAIVVLLVTMTWPALLKPLAFVWFGLSGILGGIMSKVLLSVIYSVVLVPMGLASRVFRKDPFKKLEFGKGKGSVFVDRSHVFDKSDLDNPY